MGVSIDFYIYNKQTLLSELDIWGADSPQLTHDILSACGTFFGESYVLLHNEYYGDYNPYFIVAELLDAAFKKNQKRDAFDIILHCPGKQRGGDAVEKEDVAGKLGLKLSD